MGPKYVGYRLAQGLSRGLPASCSVALADGLAWGRWRTASVTRAALQQNLATVLGEPVPWDAPLIRDVFRQFGRYVVEFFTMHRPDRMHVQVDGERHLHEARKAQRGVIALTAHLGNWELGAVAIRRLGFAVTAVALAHDDPEMDRLFNEQRRRCGIAVIPLGKEAARRSLESLRQGLILGLLGDQEFSGRGVDVSFFGQTVCLPRGPAVLSLRSRAPVVPTFLIREAPWNFRLCCEPPMWPPRHLVGEEAVQHLTQEYAVVIERYVKRFPTQWMMFRPLRREAQHA